MHFTLKDTAMEPSKISPVEFRKYLTPNVFWQIIGRRFIPIPKEDISAVILNINDKVADGKHTITPAGPVSIFCHITPFGTGLNPEIWEAESGTVKFDSDRTPGNTRIKATCTDCVVRSHKMPKLSFTLSGDCHVKDALTYP